MTLHSLNNMFIKNVTDFFSLYSFLLSEDAKQLFKEMQTEEFDEIDFAQLTISDALGFLQLIAISRQSKLLPLQNIFPEHAIVGITNIATKLSVYEDLLMQIANGSLTGLEAENILLKRGLTLQNNKHLSRIASRL